MLPRQHFRPASSFPFRLTDPLRHVAEHTPTDITDIRHVTRLTGQPIERLFDEYPDRLPDRPTDRPTDRPNERPNDKRDRLTKRALASVVHVTSSVDVRGWKERFGVKTGPLLAGVVSNPRTHRQTRCSVSMLPPHPGAASPLPPPPPLKSPRQEASRLGEPHLCTGCRQAASPLRRENVEPQSTSRHVNMWARRVYVCVCNSPTNQAARLPRRQT
ncbi:unnamed protein product [Protopolystoma xenopodis]|uniref:Uncharacterized protein n=1 Tax=Protopolystoma xenopodis TaxID=117903 RepID=A0A448XAU8_9PLAT|nr:unnamed protein product [Protopolystoma xenopodis]